MTFERKKEIPPGSGRWYSYMQESKREGKTVRSKHIAYLGTTKAKDQRILRKYEIDPVEDRPSEIRGEYSDRREGGGHVPTIRESTPSGEGVGIVIPSRIPGKGSIEAAKARAALRREKERLKLGLSKTSETELND